MCIAGTLDSVSAVHFFILEYCYSTLCAKRDRSANQFFWGKSMFGIISNMFVNLSNRTSNLSSMFQGLSNKSQSLSHISNSHDRAPYKTIYTLSPFAPLLNKKTAPPLRFPYPLRCLFTVQFPFKGRPSRRCLVGQADFIDAACDGFGHF